LAVLRGVIDDHADRFVGAEALVGLLPVLLFRDLQDTWINMHIYSHFVLHLPKNGGICDVIQDTHLHPGHRTLDGAASPLHHRNKYFVQHLPKSKQKQRAINTSDASEEQSAR